MPNFSGLWTSRQQLQAKGAGTWPAVPGAPTIGTATVASATSASITFTAPSDLGYPASVTYTVISSPGGITSTGSSSPIVVSGLTTGTAYTFTVIAVNASGNSAASAASNSVTPAAIGQQAYTTPGTYTWVAPAGVTSVSVVCVGGAGQGNSTVYGGGGGGLGYRNNYTVVPGNSYTVVVGVCGLSNGASGGDSYFVNTANVRGGGGSAPSGGPYTGTGGGSGGSGGFSDNAACITYQAGSGGAGGYAGSGGNGGNGYDSNGGTASAGTAGSGGAGGGSGGAFYGSDNVSGGGGGVGILGQGSNGAGGTTANSNRYGRGGSGGSDGSSAAVGGNYGGGRARSSNGADTSGSGAVRIIWPGTTRSFPSTNTGDL